MEDSEAIMWPSGFAACTLSGRWSTDIRVFDRLCEALNDENDNESFKSNLFIVEGIDQAWRHGSPMDARGFVAYGPGRSHTNSCVSGALLGALSCCEAGSEH